MDQAQIPTLLGLAMNAVVAVLVIISFFRRYATKDDIKDLNDRLVSVEARLGQVDASQAALISRMDSIDTRFDATDARLDRIDARLDRIDARFDRIETKLDVIEQKADASLDLHHNVRGDLKVLQAAVNRLESYFETPKLKSS